MTMISIFKNFTKKKIAGLILILVIIVAFGFGGFGGGFNLGNQNTVAKVNNTYVSTQDFMDYLNKSNLSSQVIKENIDKNILEELLSTLISTTILDLEIEDLNISISQLILIKKLKKNKNFLDENGIFQRTLYEKFLLTNNITAPLYELRMKNNMLQKQLFNYIHGGVQSPKFIVKKNYEEENKKLYINYLKLSKFYKKKIDFTDNDLKKFVNENSEKLKQDHINFSYINITPKNLIGLDDFNQTFFDKIDEIDNKISKNINFNDIVKDLNISINPVTISNYINLDNTKTIENIIYNNRANKIEILEYEGKYIFYEIDKKDSKIPNIENPIIREQLVNLLFQKEKYEFNKKILEEIDNNEFNQNSFEKLGKNFIEKIEIASINDTKKFEVNSLKVLYSLPLSDFTLISDKNENIYVAKIIKFDKKKIKQGTKEFNMYSIDVSAKDRNIILKSYDYFLNDKYKVTVNQKTLDRVKNYFK